MRELKELFQYRSLIIALVERNLSSRYRGSLLGFLWSFLNPLFLMLIYTLVFKYYIRFDQLENYSIYLFCGMLPWIWLSSGTIEAASSIASSGHLITKSMFPPQVLPVVAILTNLVHYVLSLILLFAFMLYFSVPITAYLLLLPVVMIVQTVLMYGLGLMFASLNVFFRDIQHLLGNVFNLLFFLCPILYPAEVVPEQFQFTIRYNPLACLIDIYHDLILNAKLPDLNSVLFLCLFTLLMFFLGKRVYSKYYEKFAEKL